MNGRGLLKCGFSKLPASVVNPMPIYAYKCASCGHADDVMQKMSDDALTKCPACGAEAYSKQVTAPNFALKGSGWYVTDFRGGNKPADAEGGKAGADKAADKSTSTDGKPDAGVTKSPTPETTTAAPANASPAATKSAAPATPAPAAATTPSSS